MGRRGVLLMLAACSGLLLGAGFVARRGTLSLSLIVLGGACFLPCVLPLVRWLVAHAAALVLAARGSPDRPVRRDLASGHSRITVEPDSEKEWTSRTGGPPI